MVYVVVSLPGWFEIYVIEVADEMFVPAAPGPPLFSRLYVRHPVLLT